METATRLWVKEQYGSMKEYRVWLNQTGTNVAIATIIHDSVEYVVLSRGGVGTTLFTKTDAFPMYKSTPKDTVVGYDKNGNKLVLTHVSKDQYKLETFDTSDTLADDILTDQEIILQIFL